MLQNIDKFWVRLISHKYLFGAHLLPPFALICPFGFILLEQRMYKKVTGGLSQVPLLSGLANEFLLPPSWSC